MTLKFRSRPKFGICLVRKWSIMRAIYGGCVDGGWQTPAMAKLKSPSPHYKKQGSCKVFMTLHDNMGGCKQALNIQVWSMIGLMICSEWSIIDFLNCTTVGVSTPHWTTLTYIYIYSIHVDLFASCCESHWLGLWDPKPCDFLTVVWIVGFKAWDSFLCFWWIFIDPIGQDLFVLLNSSKTWL